MTTIKEAQVSATQKLDKIGIDSSALDTDVLLSFVLKKPKEFLYTYPEKKLTASQIKKYNFLIKKRIKKMPIAYLIGHKEFFGLNFYVDKNVLIPRPLTESLVEAVIKEIKNKKAIIADIGTGSGCIAIALKKHLPQATIYAVDISVAALKVAKKNARKHHAKIIFKKGNLLDPIKKIKIDYIVANLPYLKVGQIKDELIYEPKTALLGGDKYIKKLLRQIKNLSHSPKKIFLEKE